MRFSKINTIAQSGLKTELIIVETDVTRGLFNFSIVGLPDKSVEESRERICAAIKNSGFDSPKTKHHKIISSLVPAHVKKAGSSFDLPIAISYLSSVGFIKHNLNNSIFIGELSLDGRIRRVKGVLQIILHAISEGFEEMFIPYENADEARLLIHENKNIKIFAPIFLADIVAHFKRERHIPNLSAAEIKSIADENKNPDASRSNVDLANIQGQAAAKRAAIIAVAGGHNFFLIGPPGTGKTLIARACANLMPPPTAEQAIEIAAIYSLDPSSAKHRHHERPFRAPHHTSTYTAMIGGGADLLPGEISLAHHGILFVDEFPEFDRRVIESLREPLEDGIIKIARAKQREIFPAHIMLIAAANPCPCGFRGSKKKRCVCKQTDTARYNKKISGPILDRIDLVVSLSEGDEKNSKVKKELSSEEARKLITKSRELQIERSRHFGIKGNTNSEIPFERILEIVEPDEEALKTLERGIEQLSLSMRAKHRALRVARTIADLEGSEKLKAPHMFEALSYRFRENET